MRRPAVTIPLAMLALAGVALLAAGSGGEDTLAERPEPPQLGLWIDLGLALVLLLGVAGVLAMFVAQLREAGRPSASQRAKRLGAGLGLLALLVALASLVPSREAVVEDGEGEDPVSAVEGSEREREPADREQRVERPQPAGTLPPTATLLAALAAAGAALLLRRSMASDEPATAAEEATSRQRRDLLLELLDDALEALRSHPDPREAVVMAWERLEAALAATGLAREPAEAPLRYLDRVLAALEVSGPGVKRLTWAFEVAMFSTHPIGRSTQLEAVDALVAARDELGVMSGSHR